MTSRVRRTRLLLAGVVALACHDRSPAEVEQAALPALVVSAPSIAFAATQGAADPAAQAVAVSSSGGSVAGLAATASYSGQSGSWIETALDRSSTPSTLTIAARTAGLAPGVHVATVAVSASGVSNSPVSLPVTLQIAPGPPAIALSRTVVNMTATAGGSSPPAQTVAVANGGGGTLTGLAATISFTGGPASGWLQVALTGTSAPATLSLTASTAGRPAGTYSAVITITATGAAPATVSVSLTITSPPPAIFPLANGKRWRYLLADTTTIGPSRFITVGTFVLQAITPGTLDGRAAWHLEGYEFSDQLGNSPAFRVLTFYVATDALGVLVYSDNAWRRVFSTSAASVPNGSLVLAGVPQHSPRTERSAATVNVPFGTFQTTHVEHYHREGFWQYAVEDIDERRAEHYAPGVGIVLAHVNYFYEYNVGTAGHRLYRRTLRLTHMDTGPFPEVITEAAANHAATSAQTVSGFSVVRGDVALGDAGTVLTDAAVGCSQVCIHPNRNGQKRIEDWYRLTLTATTNLRLDLNFSTAGTAEQRVDLDLYVFRQNGSQLQYVGASTRSPGTLEFLQGALTAGVYYIGVQAWDTPTGRARYWLSARTY